MLDLSLVRSADRAGEVVISSMGFQSLGVPVGAMRGSIANAAWPAANVAIFIPFVVPEPVTITKLWWLNNASPAGNLDAGIYEEDGTRLVSSGSTAMSGTQALQAADTADTLLQRGRHYLALVCDTASSNSFVCSNIAAGLCQALGVVRQAAAFPLPATATFAVTTHAFIPIMGAQGYRAVGP